MIELRLLGSLELTASDGSQILSVLSQPKRASILAYLAAAAPRGFHRRDKLMALFWPEADDEHAHGSLRQALHFLKRSLGEAALLRLGDDEVGIDPDLVWVDVAAFDAAVEAEDLHGALSLYRGDLLAGFHLPDAPDFERWVDSEGQRLRNRAVSAGERLRDQTAESGDLAGATEIARRVVELTPANGQAVRRLVEILARRGDRAGAIHAYQSFAERLHDDFEMEPPDQLRELIGEIRSGSTAASVASGTMPATSPAQVVPDTQAPLPGLALGSVTAAGGPVRRARV